MQMEQHSDHVDLSGEIAVTLANKQTLEDFCIEHLPEYNQQRFEAVAIRFFVGKETIITVYAIDKVRQKDSDLIEKKMAVKKFKISTLTVIDLFSYCTSLNFTLTTGKYPLDSMEVMNK